MKQLILFCTVCITVTVFFAAEPKLEHTEISSLYQIEKQGMQSYRAEDFDHALESFNKTAPLGFKQSQYYLAHLHLKGQSVKRNMLEGMAWLGVAKESGHKEMIKLYDSLYVKFNQLQKDAVDKKVLEYIALYGMENQNIICKKTKKVGSRRPLLECQKIPIKVDYEMNSSQDTMQ